MDRAQKNTDSNRELELPNHQRGLVDDIVEEGQYESAIEMLFQLRSPQYRPSLSHIRQLVFLALHPVENRSIEPDVRPVTETPKKSRLNKVPTSITPKAIVSALNLLSSLIATNSPESLGRALPSYGSQENVKGLEEPLDSLLAKQAACIKGARNCWELLEEGFVFRNEVVISPKGKSKLRRDYSFGEVLSPGPTSRSNGIVADEAWPFLDWLVSLFERDEDLEEQKTRIRYSELFLAQLPPPRGGSTTRWDFVVVTNIILYALEQEDDIHRRRKRIGYRLLHLLINLTNTIHVEQSTLVNSIYKSILAAWVDPLRLENFLSHLEGSLSAERFKVHFCHKLLSDIPATQTSLTTATKRPRPQARAAPKPRATGSSTNKNPTAPAPEATASPDISSKPTLPSFADVMQCLEFPIPAFPSPPLSRSLVLLARFQLVKSFATMQDLQPADARLEWDKSIQDGRLGDALKHGFTQGEGDEGMLYLEMLKESLRIDL